jgi:hypothetical protein
MVDPRWLGKIPDEHLWELRKGDRRAVLRRALHPLGIELILDVNGDLRYAKVERTVEDARGEAERMRESLIARGWAGETS